MNWHFFSFLLDIVGWVSLGLFISHAYATTNNGKNSTTMYPSSAIASLIAGFWSIANNGLPEVGLSLVSFFYVLIACSGLIMYYSAKRKIKQIGSYVLHTKRKKRIMRIHNITTFAR